MFKNTLNNITEKMLFLGIASPPPHTVNRSSQVSAKFGTVVGLNGTLVDAKNFHIHSRNVRILSSTSVPKPIKTNDGANAKFSTS
jgi:hypothetical protein